MQSTFSMEKAIYELYEKSDEQSNIWTVCKSEDEPKCPKNKIKREREEESTFSMEKAIYELYGKTDGQSNIWTVCKSEDEP